LPLSSRSRTRTHECDYAILGIFAVPRGLSDPAMVDVQSGIEYKTPVFQQSLTKTLCDFI